MYTKRPAPIPLSHSTLREEDEQLLDYSSGSSSASSAASIETIVPPQPVMGRRRPVVPLTSWTEFFEEELYLELPSDDNGDLSAKFHAYLTRPKNPAKDVLFLCHHGAGACGLSFALLARELRKHLPSCGILSIEAREHGSTVYSASSSNGPSSGQSEVIRKPSTDLSMKALTTDFMTAMRLVATKLDWEGSKWPPTVLVGHSLGGSVVTRVAKSVENAKTLNLAGVCVIDVVEGSAMDALKSMQSYLATRPTTFTSVEDAIDWHVRSRTVRNIDSAKVSTPPLLVPQDGDGELWAWRTDLGSTSLYWRDWFDGMSGDFLAAKAAKLLILAGTDRLDKQLMIGQMQGKFQLAVVPEAGHFVQEDSPEKTADLLSEFWRRNDRSALVLPPKVSDLLKAGKKV